MTAIEARALHTELKTIFQELKDSTEQLFEQRQRDKVYQYYLKRLIQIQNRTCHSPDAQ